MIHLAIRQICRGMIYFFMIKSQRKGHYLEITVPEKWAGITIEELLKNIYKAPKKLVHEWRMAKDILLSGTPANWTQALQKGEQLYLPLYKHEVTLPEAAFIDISVLYEDDDLLVVNKPAGIETHPSEQGQNQSLLNAVAYHLLIEGENCELRHIHRLDKDTTGAILFSKNAFAGAILQQMLDERTIKRTYKALVHGKLSQRKGTISSNIGRDRHHATRRRVSPTGQTAVTHFQTLHYNRKDDLTLVQCTLDTGRTHQIRVHLSSIGHPLAGDTLYGGEPIFSRQALHACKIQFNHPITEENIEIEAPFIDNPPIFK